MASDTASDTVTENVYWKNVLTIIPIVMCVLATTSYFLRLICRRVLAGAPLKTEDILMGIGLVLSYGVTAFTVYTAFNGVGVPTSSLPQAERRRINFGSWMIQKFWAPSMAFIKTSIIVFLDSTLGTSRSFRLAARVLIVFIALWATAALLTNIFQCWPVQYYFDKTIVGGHCMRGQTQFFEATGSLSLIADVAILILPIPVVWNLMMNPRQKIAVTAVLSLGIFVCVFSLLRLVEFRNFLLNDLSSSSAKESIWTTMEVNVSIICGCLPLMAPLCQGCLGKLTSTGYGRSNRSTSNPASTPKLFYKSTPSRNDKAFQRLAELKSTATGPGDKSSERQLWGSRMRSEADRSSSEVELQEIRVQTEFSMTTVEDVGKGQHDDGRESSKTSLYHGV